MQAEWLGCFIECPCCALKCQLLLLLPYLSAAIVTRNALRWLDVTGMRYAISKTPETPDWCSVLLSPRLPSMRVIPAPCQEGKRTPKCSFKSHVRHYDSSSPVSHASTSSTAPGRSGPVAYFDSVSWMWMIALPGMAATAFLHSSNSSCERTRKPSSMLGSSSAIPSLRTRRVWHDAISSGDGSSGSADRVECGSR